MGHKASWDYQRRREQKLFFFVASSLPWKKGEGRISTASFQVALSYFWFFRFVVPPSSALAALLLHPSGQQHASLICNRWSVQPVGPDFLSRNFFGTTQARYYGVTLEIALTCPRFLCSYSIPPRGNFSNSPLRFRCAVGQPLSSYDERWKMTPCVVRRVTSGAKYYRTRMRCRLYAVSYIAYRRKQAGRYV